MRERDIYERTTQAGDTRYCVRVVIARRRISVTCPTLEDAIAAREILLQRAERAAHHRRERKARGVEKREVIYFVQAGDDGPIKIGRTRAELVPRRLANLQIASYVELRLLAVVDGDSEGERELHRRLRAHRIRGEWFHPVADLHAIIETPPRWIRGTSLSQPLTQHVD